jgi:RNA polymerase sigma factor (sigma-70 family)
MDYSNATDEQLKTIIRFDKDCPAHLLSGVVTEMMNRSLFEGLIKNAIIKRFTRIEIAASVLKMDEEDMFQYCQMTIFEALNTYVPGKQTFVYYAFLCLRSKLSHLEQQIKAEKRKVYEGLISTDDDTNILSFLQSQSNVELTVVRKIMLEDGFSALREIEKNMITLEQQGYTQCEIAEMFGMNKRSGNVVLKRAYAKMRKQMGA